MSALTIDLFSDIVCPWCFIGARRLEAALAAAPGGAGVTVRYHPFLLDPSTPPEGVDLVERLRRKYGGDPRQAFARVEGAARSAGIPLDMSRVERTYPTVAGHTLMRHAPDARALADALFTAYFLEARNIADPEVLASVAAGHGLDAGAARDLVTDERELALTRRAAEQASAAGITGVPFFVFDGRFAMSGAQPPAVFEQALARAFAGAGSKESTP